MTKRLLRNGQLVIVGCKYKEFKQVQGTGAIEKSLELSLQIKESL